MSHGHIQFILFILAFLIIKFSNLNVYQKWRERATGWRVMAGKPLNNVLPGRQIIRLGRPCLYASTNLPIGARYSNVLLTKINVKSPAGRQNDQIKPACMVQSQKCKKRCLSKCD